MIYSIPEIEGVLQGVDGAIKNVEVSRLTKPGENYLSLVYRVDVEVEKNGKTSTIHAVAKCLPLTKTALDFNAFSMRNEIKWYSEILPLIKNFGSEYGIDTDFYPEYLGSRYSLDPTKTEIDKDSALLMRNLIPDGYQNDDRHIGLDLPSAKVLLKYLASFHAAPLALKFKKPDVFKQLKEYLESTRPPMPPAGPEGPGGPGGSGGPPKGPPGAPKYSLHKLVLEQMLTIPQCQPYLAKIEELRNRPSQAPFEQGPIREPWSTIVHSDFWVNNLMLKRNEGKVEVKIVDFQMCSYGSYAKDLVFFLLSSVQDSTQQSNLDELLRFYYEELVEVLHKVGVPELKLTFEEFLAEVKLEANSAEVLHALFFSTIVFGEKGTGPDLLVGEADMLEHIDLMVKNLKKNARQKEKLGVILEVAVSKDWL
ncbi:uncharacterized protein LOC109543988 [Dendroctonus ponderosae]|uniref:uncharacterized protein LOC109543988 n=1 Tax=Dendroctonus ponderosae TaxID=77166 RepID=UPI002035B788|nr:uncharacterized protein LOC109543988 [Dendroctonus ponderosae]